MAERAALVKDGLVVNVILLEPDADYTPPDGSTAVFSDTAQIGWAYDSETGEFAAPPEPEA